VELNEVVTFFRHVADIEHRGTIAVLTERDDDKVQELVREWAALQENGIPSGIDRSSRVPADYFEHVAGTENIFPRTVFAAARYQQGKRALYRGWMGTEFNRMAAGDTVSENFFVVEDGKALKMRARYSLCSMCNGLTKASNGSDCRVCHGLGFEFLFGTQVGKLGPMKEFLKLADPDQPDLYPAWPLALEEAKRLGSGASKGMPKKKAVPAKRATRKK
jgi:hypothetical protein